MWIYYFKAWFYECLYKLLLLDNSECMFLSKRVKKLIILQHFLSNSLSKITSLRCNTTLLYRKAKLLFGPYFREKTWSAASYCSLKVTKPPGSLKNWGKICKNLFPLAGFDPRFTAWQSRVLTIRPPKLRYDWRKMEGTRINLNLKYFFHPSLTYPSTDRLLEPKTSGVQR